MKDDKTQAFFMKIPSVECTLEFQKYILDNNIFCSIESKHWSRTFGEYLNEKFTCPYPSLISIVREGITYNIWLIIKYLVQAIVSLVKHF